MPDSLPSPWPPGVRRQLSLFVPEASAARLEAIRLRLDPVQHALIPAHVTLCREDELAALADPAWRERWAGVSALSLTFGAPVAFDGHGVLLPVTHGAAAFAALRKLVLGREPERVLQPHLTLAHPRNPRAAGNTADALTSVPAGLEIRFDAVRLIEQRDAGPWQVLERHGLQS